MNDSYRSFVNLMLRNTAPDTKGRIFMVFEKVAVSRRLSSVPATSYIPLLKQSKSQAVHQPAPSQSTSGTLSAPKRHSGSWRCPRSRACRTWNVSDSCISKSLLSPPVRRNLNLQLRWFLHSIHDWPLCLGSLVVTLSRVTRGNERPYSHLRPAQCLYFGQCTELGASGLDHLPYSKHNSSNSFVVNLVANQSDHSTRQ